MKLDVLLGLQWGDEGKGKIVDFLAPQYDYVARFQGGPNAGHTLEFEGVKHVLHQIPSGVFRKGPQNIIGNGMVLDPVEFKKEAKALEPYEIRVKENLYISKRTQIILPSHRLLDAAYEKEKGKDKIGSTLRGIGPTYQDKIARTGLRVGDISLPSFQQRYSNLVKRHRAILEFLEFEHDLSDHEPSFWEAIDFLRGFRLVDGEVLVNQILDKGGSILAEGAQGSLLDIDFGSYPFVTSSTTMAAGACTGLGVAPRNLGEVMGIFKAYCTRVGSGPFPTELEDSDGEKLRKEGDEFGATTGRPRRCGWLDLPALHYACMINGVSQLFMMKLDVLNSFKKIKVCTHYQADGKDVDTLPFEIGEKHFEPIYRSFEGWMTDLSGVRSLSGMPSQVHRYLEFLESELQLPIRIVSIGPDRAQTILKENVGV